MIDTDVQIRTATDIPTLTRLATTARFGRRLMELTLLKATHSVGPTPTVTGFQTKSMMTVQPTGGIRLQTVLAALIPMVMESLTPDRIGHRLTMVQTHSKRTLHNGTMVMAMDSATIPLGI